jgi:enamine deaminase RidA (YjgF/YER057c/UK114 family)
MSKHGIALPPAPGPKANYLPYKRVGNTLYLSGHLPLDDFGELLTGTVGKDLDVAMGQHAAKLCALNLLASMEHAVGSLDEIASVTKLVGLVRSADDFVEQHLVMNGASDVMVQVFGPDAGIHARSAIGVNTLPLGMAVEVEAVVEIKPKVTRLHTDDPRMSGVVDDGETVYLSGQVPADFDAPLEEQVSSTLAKVDALLESAGTSKKNLVSAQLWLKNMDDFGEMNKIWSAWVDPENKPVRACVEAPMAAPGILFEVMVVAKK